MTETNAAQPSNDAPVVYFTSDIKLLYNGKRFIYGTTSICSSGRYSLIGYSVC